LEHHTFQDERIVGGHHTDAIHAVPAGPAETGYVAGNEEICLEPFSCGGYMSETRGGGGRGKKRWHHSTVLPRTVGLKVFRVSKLTILKDSDRVNSAQTTVKFSTWDVVAHTLYWIVVSTPAQPMRICVGYTRVGNTPWTPPASRIWKVADRIHGVADHLAYIDSRWQLSSTAKMLRFSACSSL